MNNSEACEWVNGLIKKNLSGSIRVKLVIPAIPPSVNHYWGSVGNRRFLTKRAKEWKALVSACCIGQLSKRFKPIQERVKATIIFYAKSNRGDLDNRLKAVFDSINGVVWQDDRLVDEILVQRKKAVESKTIVIIEVINEVVDE